MSLIVYSRLFIFSHILLPLILFSVSFFAIEYYHFDLYLADHIFAYGGDRWIYKDHWLLESLLHKGGRNLVASLLILNLILTLCSFFSSRLFQYRKGLLYLFFTTLTCILTISFLKGVTHISCPWDMQRYGGKELYSPTFHAIFNSGRARCFPAGHASGAYAWFTLYFFCREYFPNWRWASLIFVISLGIVFGVTQQLRGAHFISHDLFTLSLCWFISLAMYCLFLRRKAR